MLSAKAGKIRTLVFGTAIVGAGIYGAMTLAADEAVLVAAPTLQQSQAMSHLVVPPSPDTFVLAGQDAGQEQQGETTQSSWAAQTCVDRLDSYIEPMFITFEPGEMQVTAEHAPLLTHIAALVASCDEAHLQVAGHADGSGDDRTNLALSWDRADETLNLLVSHGVDPAALEAVGYGARAPMSQGSDDDDAANRRVDFRVLRRRD